MPVIPGPARESAQKTYKAGTLVYTKAALLALMSWLLWGDFVFNFMEIVIGAFLPLKIKGMNAPDWYFGVALATVPGLLGMVFTPVYSVASDRTRTRYGRRIPYLLLTTPVVTLLLVAIAFSDTLGQKLHDFLGPHVSQQTTLLAMFAVLIAAFFLFNGFMTSAYYNLLNDVVPPEVISRFLALFRIVGVVATSLFQFFFFGMAKTHMVELIVGSALLYGAMFMVMSLLVKEGDYPPPAHDPQPGGIWFNHLKTYMRECFCHKIYWYFFLAAMFWNINFISTTYRVFFAQSVGLELDQYGRLMGVAGIASALILYPAGALGDRWHPVRTMTLGVFLLLLVVPLQLAFVLYDIPPTWGTVFYMVLFVLQICVQALANAAMMPLQMRVLPRDRFAQLGSAAGMIQGIGTMAAGALLGGWLSWLAAREPAPLHHYRYLPIWGIAAYIACLVFMALLYREWKRLGGDKAYAAP